MSTGIVIESERPGTIAAHDLYLFRVIEPHVTGNFATLVHMRIDDQWHLIWYPNVSSDRLRSFEVGSKEKGFRRVERWAALHGASLPAQVCGGHGRFSTYETRRL
ncbi:hypothetical protein [Dyella japonica]|uniref:Uncharacterized protein n=1 Tax=Dyella japonica A8 TaxID=1217721 RepID=A0A075JXR0_9GAMM|nr:hypothetical protein [Dyella japonica]AIF46370.1 hypothetical protein HY57_03415 [Dyella japonica A8]